VITDPNGPSKGFVRTGSEIRHDEYEGDGSGDEGVCSEDDEMPACLDVEVSLLPDYGEAEGCDPERSGLSL